MDDASAHQRHRAVDRAGLAAAGILLLAAMLLTGAAASGETAVRAPEQEPATTSAPQQLDVRMQDNLFTPADATVATGGTVTWINEGSFGHNAASMFPDKTFDGPRILTGETFSHTFTGPDVYRYECVFHPAMVGTITVITDGAPAAPTIGRASAGVGSATIAWTPPEDSGASPLVGYRVRVDNGLGAFVRDVEVPDPQATQTRVAGLRRGTAYRFEVAALNDVGQSLFSAPSNVVVTPRRPFAPRIGRATAGAPGGPRTAIARWRRPLNNGGAPITGYVVTALRITASHQVGRRVRSPVLPATARSRAFRLPHGHYRFVVAASNAVGTGLRSDRSNRVTPR